MSTQDSASAYHQTSAFGASPVGQVVALYDTILRDFHRAIAAIDAGQIEKRVNATNHALMVIGELQGVLDFERGGEVAGNLNNFYNVTRPMITHASITSSREELRELIAMYTRIRAAWSQVERTTPASQPADRPRVSAPPQPAFSQSRTAPADHFGETPRSNWSA